MTPTPADSATPTPTSTPTLEPAAAPSQTPTASPTPTYLIETVEDVPLVVARGGVEANIVSVHFRHWDGSHSVQSFAAFDETTNPGGAVAAVAGDVDADGDSEVVVGQDAGKGRGRRNWLRVYRVREAQAPEMLDEIPAFESPSISSSGNLTVGDVDPFEPGLEIIVGADGSVKRSSQLRVFGGLAEGRLRLLAWFRSIPSRTAERQPLRFMVGDVLEKHAGEEIVVGDNQGWLRIYGLQHGRVVRLGRFPVFLDLPGSPAYRIAAGDVIPSRQGHELLVGDNGTHCDGLIRVLDLERRQTLLEFEALSPNEAVDGVQLWVADVIDDLPGDELIVGQGNGGGRLRVFSLTQGTPQWLFDLPDPLGRTTSSWSHLAVGDLFPGTEGNEIAVAQRDPTFPIQVFALDSEGATLVDEIHSEVETGSAAAFGPSDQTIVRSIAVAR